MQIRFKKTDPRATMPTRATDGAAGYDLTAVSMEPGRYKDGKTTYKYHTGIAVEIPPGFVGLVFPRSSIVKTGAMLGNSAGVIDSDYRGEISFVFYADSMNTPPYVPAEYKENNEPGDRIGQIVVVPHATVEFIEAETLSETKRGTGGYGSTGR